MKRLSLSLLVAIVFLSSCSLLQRGAILGTLVGNTCRETMNVTGGGVAKLLHIEPSTCIGLMSGPPTYELSETNRRLLLADGMTVDPETGEVKLTNLAMAAYEKHIALQKANTIALIAQNQRLIEASKSMAKSIGADGQRIQVTSTQEGGLQITIISELLFEPESAQIKSALYPVLDEVATVINEEYPEAFIAIEGHTGPSEAPTEYTSNWELSAARAISVLHYFNDQDLIPADRMAIAGYSSNRPMADPATLEGQKANRRVVINVIPNEQNQFPVQ